MHFFPVKSGNIEASDAHSSIHLTKPKYDELLSRFNSVPTL